MTTRIIIAQYRYKPPPKKPKKLAPAVEVPVVVVAKKSRASHPQGKAAQMAVSISRKRARLLAAARETERFMEPGEVIDDAAAMRAVEIYADNRVTE
jgi:hypothetical protein